jgi:hypothetical protein
MRMKNYFDLRQEQDIVEQSMLAEEIERYLEEKLLVLGKGSNYGQAVILAGGSGSGKSFAITNFMQGEKFKVFNVDALKDTLISIRERLKKNPDAKVESSSIKDIIRAIQDMNLRKPSDTGRLHMAAKKLGASQGPNPADIADPKLWKDIDFKDPEGVSTMKDLLKGFNVDQKQQIMFFADPNRSELPNVMFDVTLKDMGALVGDVGGEAGIVQLLKLAGYKPQNIHVVWILTNYKIAMRQNLTRGRVVNSEIFFSTHRGASGTMQDIVFKQYGKFGINGDIAVILGGGEGQVEYGVGSYRTKDGKEFTINQPLKYPVFRDFKYFRVKKAGEGSINREALMAVRSYIETMAPPPNTTPDRAQAEVIRKIMSDFSRAEKFISTSLEKGIPVETIKREYSKKFPPLRPIHKDTAESLGLSLDQYVPVLSQRVAEILGLKPDQYALRR